MIRQAFERFISSPPFEKDIERFPTDGAKYPWPGAYRDITVELAWECWREATSMQIARFEADKKRLRGQLQHCVQKLSRANRDARDRNEYTDTIDSANRAIYEIFECPVKDSVSGGVGEHEI